MYSNLKNVQILIAMLKKRGIKNIVCSAGNSHNAILRSLEEDDYFKTYSIVDERSAAFFACGLIQELNEPVAICCTAGTAATNYLTGVTEASRRSLPLIVITADKNPYYLAQYEDQMIEQMEMFKPVTKYSCSLPMIKDAKDEWYCNRVINETFLEMQHHGSGPVQINVVIDGGMLAIGNDFKCTSLPDINVIERYDLIKEKEGALKKISSLERKKVMFICGQELFITDEHKQLITKIFKKSNSIFATDKLSNVHCEGTLEISRATKIISDLNEELMPDVVISLGGNTALDLKFKLKNNSLNFEHWIVNEEGRVADPFKKLTAVFEGTTVDFLRCVNEAMEGECTHSLYDVWRNKNENMMVPDFEYSNLYAVKRLMESLPADSIVNIGNSTNIRIAQYFDMDPNIKVYCNRGVNGIDGCVSTFIGQSAVTDKMSFIMVGDLTFFYDMNALWNRYVGKNIRIMLNNNGGAALFHFNQGLINYPTLNENVAASHAATAKGWAESLGIKYISANNKKEFEEGLKQFIIPSDKPILFEVFTKKETDAKLQHEFFDMNKPAISKLKKGIKGAVKSVIGDEFIRKIKTN